LSPVEVPFAWSFSKMSPKTLSSTPTRIARKVVIRRSVILLLTLSALAAGVVAQRDLPRQTVAITYPLDQTVAVRFRGTTRLPRLSGNAKVRRAGRRGTRVELNVENLPRASELGGAYTTYVLWAISPDGAVDNLGEIKRSGSSFVDSKVDVTTPLQTFSLVVTAEPHFLVRIPSRMVVLENLAPQRSDQAGVAVVNVQYIGNSSDYFRDARVPEIAETDYRETPTTLLGARQALNLARYAGAERDAPAELQTAQTDLQLAENAWRTKQATAEVDIMARRATSSGAKAEEMALARKASRVRREELERRDAAVRTAEKSAAESEREIGRVNAELESERRARELAERDAESATQQLRDARTEIARLRDELQTVRAEGDDAKLKLARLEGEKQAEENRRSADRRAVDQRAAADSLKQALARYGSVRDNTRGLLLVLPESIWANPRSSNLSPSASARLEPLAALLANNADYQIVIETFTDNRGSEIALQQLTQDRARVLSETFAAGGLDVTRMQPNGMGAANPVAPNTTPAGRIKNRRTEVTLIPTSQASNE
jgi:outer membrane protein OmpA-like peptidoglycan-associated protein